MFDVTMTKRAKKRLAKMPALQVSLFTQLVIDLEESGPAQPEWPPFSPLGSLLGRNCNRSANRGLLCWQS